MAGGDKVQEEESFEVFKTKTNAELLKAKLDTEQLQLLIETTERAKVVSLVFLNPFFHSKKCCSIFGMDLSQDIQRKAAIKAVKLEHKSASAKRSVSTKFHSRLI